MVERLTRWAVRFTIAAMLIVNVDLAAVCTIVVVGLVLGAGVALWREQDPEWNQARAWLVSADRGLT